MQTIVTIVGARPQFIKVAPVSKALAETGAVNEVLVHTGQHHDAGMSEVFFQELGLPAPAFNLEVNGGGHGAMTGAMMQKLEPILQELRPDRVLIYGDTNSTLAGALVAAKLHVPVAHVEAGLRSFNRAMPEEVNRIVADSLSDMLFASTAAAVRNLTNEGVSAERIFPVGDVMYDVALQVAEAAALREGPLKQLGLDSGAYVLATVHRAENTDDPRRLGSIFAALEKLSREIPVVMPLHPRTAKAAAAAGLTLQGVRTIPPVGYVDMAMLESRAALIVTDSGGVQKEAFFYRVPCVTLRDETEWVELVELGWNRLASPSMGDKLAEIILEAVGSKGVESSPYGDGQSARRIAEIIRGAGKTDDRTT